MPRSGAYFRILCASLCMCVRVFFFYLSSEVYTTRYPREPRATVIMQPTSEFEANEKQWRRNNKNK